MKPPEDIDQFTNYMIAKVERSAYAQFTQL